MLSRINLSLWAGVSIEPAGDGDRWGGLDRWEGLGTRAGGDALLGRPTCRLPLVGDAAVGAAIPAPAVELPGSGPLDGPAVVAAPMGPAPPAEGETGGGAAVRRRFLAEEGGVGPAPGNSSSEDQGTWPVLTALFFSSKAAFCVLSSSRFWWENANLGR